jgi:EAL and modified HD-GYP domain-containing signal transduction protein
MADSESSAINVCITRQPILDLKSQVFGYELLYRTGADDSASEESTESDHASSRVLADAVLGLGLDALTGGKPAFVKFSRNLLLSDAATLLPAKSMVIELSGDIDVDAGVVDACGRLQELGYAISLDDYAAGTDAEAELLSYVKFARVDVLQTPVEERAALARRLQPLGVQLIAKKVETADTAAEVKQLGYKLFQGYYFCKPTKVSSSKGMPERRLAYLNLLSALNRDNLTVSELEELVKHDVSLSYRVLRLINSAAYGLKVEITSIRQALVLLGLNQIRKSASVWALAGANTGGTQEVVSVALLRARCCELIGSELPGAEDGGGYFLLGLCSLLDAIVGKPMVEALKEMPLPALIRDALLGENNQARNALDAVIAYEQGEWDEADACLERLRVKVTMPQVYADALKWARELSKTAQAA